MMDVLSDLLSDPSFVRPVTILRREETVDEHGIGSTQERPLQIFAVVTTSPGGPLSSTPDARRQPASLILHTASLLRGAEAEHQPDVVVHLGQRYEIVEVRDWRHLGGFIRAEARLFPGEGDKS